METQKPLWVRGYSCPSCGFELDGDWNAALNVLSLGVDKPGMVQSEDTPVETTTAVSTDSDEYSCFVVEAGSSDIKEAASAAEQDGVFTRRTKPDLFLL